MKIYFLILLASSLALFARVQCNEKDISRNFCRACANGDFSGVKAMLKKHLVVGQRDVLGLNAVSACRYEMTPLMVAASRGDQKIVASLLKVKYINEYVLDHAGWMAFHHAVKSGSTICVKMLLLKYPNTLNQVTYDGWSALHIASAAGHEEIVKFLLSFENVSINAILYDGSNALHLAACFGHLGVVNLLLNGGARVVENSDYHKDHSVFINYKNSLFDGFTAFHWAIYGGHKTIAETIAAHPLSQVNLFSAQQKIIGFQHLFRFFSDPFLHINGSDHLKAVMKYENITLPAISHIIHQSFTMGQPVPTTIGYFRGLFNAKVMAFIFSLNDPSVFNVNVKDALGRTITERAFELGQYGFLSKIITFGSIYFDDAILCDLMGLNQNKIYKDLAKKAFLRKRIQDFIKATDE